MNVSSRGTARPDPVRDWLVSRLLSATLRAPAAPSRGDCSREHGAGVAQARVLDVNVDIERVRAIVGVDHVRVRDGLVHQAQPLLVDLRAGSVGEQYRQTRPDERYDTHRRGSIGSAPRHGQGSPV